jgi:hypothetical protein
MALKYSRNVQDRVEHPEKYEKFCQAKSRKCSACFHRFTKEERELTACPECGRPRFCWRWATGGYKVCVSHGSGSPKKGRAHDVKKNDDTSGMRRKFLPQRLLESYDEASEDKRLLELRRDLSLVEARINDLLSRADKGESGALWDKVKDTWLRYRRAEAGGNDRSMQAELLEMGEWIEKGFQDRATWEEIADLTERRRKLVESERRRLLEMHQMISVERVLALMEKVAGVIDEKIEDSQIKGAIAYSLKELLTLNVTEHDTSRIEPKRAMLMDVEYEEID